MRYTEPRAPYRPVLVSVVGIMVALLALVPQSLAQAAPIPAPGPTSQDKGYALLKEAWEGYMDSQHRDRATVEAKFLRYLAENEESPFAPEVYFLIGTLYGSNANLNGGESIDREKAIAYYRKALVGYGEKYSNGAMVAQSYVTAANGRAPDYYDWLKSFEKADIGAVFPIQELSRYVAQGGGSPLKGQKLLENELRSLQARLPAHIAHVAKGMVQMAKVPALEEMAKEYADSELGVLARRRLEELRNAGPEAP